MPYSPWRELAARPHVHLRFEELDGCDSLYDPMDRAVILDPRLRQDERRCALTHELVHEERGDHRLADPVLAAKQEHAVDCEAARRLIDLHALTDALMWTTHGWELADTLGVDVPTAYCRLANLTDLELAQIRARWREREGSA